MPDSKKKSDLPKKITCQFCNEEEVEVPPDTEVGDVLECDNCGAEVEVINTKPLRTRIIMEEK